MARGNAFDFSDVFATMYGSEATGGAEEVVTVSVRDAGAEDGRTADDVELWSMGCAVYRPAPPDDGGKCQVLTADIGGRKIAVASRDGRASEAFGALNEGDAAFGSPTGKGMLRANADGSVGIRKNGQNGASDAWIQIEADGTIIVGNAAGQLELSEDNGFVVALADGSFLQLSGRAGFVVSAPTSSLQSSSVALGVGAAKPLAITPVPGGFAAVSPVLNVFVP